MLKVSEHIANCANAMTAKYDIFSFYTMYSESTTFKWAISQKTRYGVKSITPVLSVN